MALIIPKYFYCSRMFKLDHCQIVVMPFLSSNTKLSSWKTGPSEIPESKLAIETTPLKVSCQPIQSLYTSQSQADLTQEYQKWLRNPNKVLKVLCQSLILPQSGLSS